MENNFYTNEKIEAYLTDKLRGKEKEMFEDGLSKDPLLKNEVALQKDIIDALKSHRHAQLKQRLNNIELGTGATFSGMKAAASLLVAAMISGGAYYFLTSEEKEPLADTGTEIIFQTEDSSDNMASSADKSTSENNSEQNEIIFSQPESSETATSPKPASGNKAAKNNKQQNFIADNSAAESSEKTTIKKKIVEPSFLAPELKEGFDEGDIQKDPNTKVPDATLSQNTNRNQESLAVQVLQKKGKDFHYQYYNNMLFLYGNFNSKPYEIIEMNTSKAKNLYILYEGSYYGLKSNQIQIAPLEEISNPQVIKDLDSIRK